MRAKQPEISILMSLYNETDQQISESVRSILSQTFKNWEFIIVNDAPHNQTLLSTSRQS